jgi:hypothetical protein
MRKRQNLVALSTIEIEYMEATHRHPYIGLGIQMILRKYGTTPDNYPHDKVLFDQSGLC